MKAEELGTESGRAVWFKALSSGAPGGEQQGSFLFSVSIHVETQVSNQGAGAVINFKKKKNN